MRSKVFNYTAGLATAAVMSLATAQGVQAQGTEAYQRGTTASPPSVTLTFDATVASVMTIALQADGGVYDSATNVTITTEVTSDGVTISGPLPFATVRGVTDTGTLYLYSVDNALSVTGGASGSTVTITYSEHPSTVTAGRMYAKETSGVSSLTSISGANAVTAGGYDISAPLASNVAYKSAGYTGTAISSSATTVANFSQKAGYVVNDSDPEGLNIIAILAATAKYTP